MTTSQGLGSVTSPMRDGFGPLNLGGTVGTKYGTITYLNTSPVKLFSLQKGSVLTAIRLVVATAFDDTGTDLLNVGDGTTANRFINAQSLASAGLISTGVYAQLYTKLAEDVDVYAVYAGQNGNAANGSAVVAFEYMLQGS